MPDEKPETQYIQAPPYLQDAKGAPAATPAAAQGCAQCDSQGGQLRASVLVPGANSPPHLTGFFMAVYCARCPTKQEMSFDSRAETWGDMLNAVIEQGWHLIYANSDAKVASSLCPRCALADGPLG